MSELLLGKLDPVRLENVNYLSAYATSPLAVPPASLIVPTIADWRMCLNDTYGDCTIAAIVHAMMVWNLDVSESDTIPGDPAIKTTYFQQTGGQDTGLVETSLLQNWVTNGLFGYKIPAWAPVPHDNVEAIKQSVYYYGACYLGVQLPQSAQQQFVQGGNSTWSVVPGSPIEGGHAILAVGYSPEGLYIISWGQVVLCTWEWVAKYLDEAYAIIAHQFVEAGKGPNLDLVALTADLKDA